MLLPVVFQLSRVDFLHQATLVNNADTLRQPGHFAQNVARHENGDTLFAGQAGEQVAHLNNTGRIQPVGRLIQDEQFRAVQQCFGHP